MSIIVEVSARALALNDTVQEEDRLHLETPTVKEMQALLALYWQCEHVIVGIPLATVDDPYPENDA